MVTGGTDARHYTPLTAHVLRFGPARMTPENAKGLHGVNEWIDVDDYLDAIDWYEQLLRDITN